MRGAGGGKGLGVGGRARPVWGDDDRPTLADDRPGRAALFARRRPEVDDAAVEPHALAGAGSDPLDREARRDVDGAAVEVDGAGGGGRIGAGRAEQRRAGDEQQQGGRQQPGRMSFAVSGDHRDPGD